MVFEIIRGSIQLYVDGFKWLLRPLYNLVVGAAKKLLKVSTIAEYRSNVQFLDNQLNERYWEIDRLKKQIKDLELKAGPFEMASAPLRKEIDSLGETISKRENGTMELLHDIECAKSEISDLQETMKRKEESHAEEILALEGKLDKIDEECYDLKLSKESRQEEIDKLNQELGSCRKEMDDRYEDRYEESKETRERLWKTRRDNENLKRQLEEKDSELEKERMEKMELKEENKLLRAMDLNEKHVYYSLLRMGEATIKEIRDDINEEIEDEEKKLSKRQIEYAIKKLIERGLVVEVEKGSSRSPSYYAAVEM